MHKYHTIDIIANKLECLWFRQDSDKGFKVLNEYVLSTGFVAKNLRFR